MISLTNHTELFQLNYTQISQFKAQFILPRTHVQSAASTLNQRLVRVADVVEETLHQCGTVLIGNPARTLALFVTPLLVLYLLYALIGRRTTPTARELELLYLKDNVVMLERMIEETELGCKVMEYDLATTEERALAVQAQLAGIRPGTEEIQRRLNNVNQFAEEMRRLVEAGQGRYIGNDRIGLVLDDWARNMNGWIHGCEDLKNLCDKVIGQFNQL